ncbi:MAG: hypothetical protein LBB40_03195, partial [Holophagales bacterium]|nr:hypothetical protein [Holophagales bacterium]
YQRIAPIQVKTQQTLLLLADGILSRVFFKAQVSFKVLRHLSLMKGIVNGNGIMRQMLLRPAQWTIEHEKNHTAHPAILAVKPRFAG